MKGPLLGEKLLWAHAACGLVLMLAFLPSAFAQDTGTVVGTVTDAQGGNPIPGVNVLVEGESLGGATDGAGRYAIESVPAGEQTVVAQFVGYQTKRRTVQVSASDTTRADFQMGQDALDLEEVVVTGTGGPVEKRKLGNTISTVNTADLANAPVQDMSEILQGREPGVSGMPGGGNTGSGSQIRIRGSSSLSQSNEPVVYLDGVRINSGGGFSGPFVGAGGPGTTSRLDDLNPDAIERVEILKGAAAATLYGSEASNGVIQIFTKRGNAGPPQFNFSTTQGMVSLPEGNIQGNSGFARTRAQADTMSAYHGGSIQPFQLVTQNVLPELFETGRVQTYNGSVSGGTPGVTYFVSGRFSTEDGPLGAPEGMASLSQDNITRAQGTATVNIFPTDQFQIRATSSYIETEFDTYNTGNNIYATPEAGIIAKPELVGHNNRYGSPAFLTLRESLQQQVSQEVQRFSGSIGLNYRPLEMLNLSGTFGVDFTDVFSEEGRPYGWNVDDFSQDTPDGNRGVANDRNLEISFNAQANLTNTLGDNWESTFVTGTQGFITRNSVSSIQGQDFPGPGFSVVSAAGITNNFESFREVVQAGVYGQEQVGFNDYIFGTLGVRLDANSAFGSDFQAAVYPKASVSVVPSDAPFWSSSLGPLSSLRLRAAVGQSGLQPGAFDSFRTFSPLSAPGAPGIVPNNLGNSDLRPEISTEWEVGTELGFFEGRGGIEATYWNRTVNDALVNRQFPVTGGFRSLQLVNIGQLEGQGLELGLNASLLEREDVSFSLFANASYLWEQVTDLGGAPPIKVGGSYPRPRNYIVEGYAPGTNFGAQLRDVPEGSLPVDFNGDDQPDTEEQVLDYLGGLSVEEFVAGDNDLPASTGLVLLAQGGNENLSAPLNQYLGKPTPDWQGAFGFDLTLLDNFSVGTLFEFKFGNFFVNDLSGAFQRSNPSIGRNTPVAARTVRDYYTGGVNESGTPQNDPQVRLEALETWLGELLALSPFSGLNAVQPADFLRWRELSLTYEMPQTFVEGLGVRELSFTLAGRNLALFTEYDGLDPESNEVSRGGAGDTTDQNFRQGIEAWNIPVPRRFTVQVNVGF